MSQQAGPSTSTEGDNSKLLQNSSQQSATGAIPSIGSAPQFASFDPATQQAILQQIAAARGGNPAAAAFFANLNLGARKNSGSNASTSNGSAASPAATAASPSASTADVATLQAQLQAKLIQSQQALALRQAQNANPQSPADSAKPAGMQDFAAAAAASGMLGNVGGDREAIMKQLQALQQSQQARAKHAASLGGVGSPSAGPGQSPGSVTAPSPAAMLAQSPAAAPTPTAEVQSPAAAARSAGTPSTPASTTARPGMPVRPPIIQKQQLLNSLLAFYKSTHQPLPSEVFNGEHDGAFKLGDSWIELADLFIAVFRLGGLAKLMQMPSPGEHPVWTQVLSAKGVPQILPSPVALPRQPGISDSIPTQTTNNAVQYLMAAYRAWIFGFEQAMARTRTAAFQKQQAAAAAAGKSSATPTPATPTAPGPPVGIPTPVPEASPQAFTAPSPAVPTPPPVAASPAAPGASPAAPTPVATQPKLDISATPTPLAVNGTPPSDRAPKKRKRELRQGKSPSTPAKVSTPASAGTPAPEPSQPKRARYRVEYRPLHFPHPMMGGWDERAVTSAFPKHQLGRPAKPVQELQVDIEAVLMGFRSRLPLEIGYGLTVLSMLSMPLQDGKTLQIPMEYLMEVYMEVLELIAECALGEGGIERWLESPQPAEPTSARTSVSREHVERMSYAELEQLGNDCEYMVDDEAPKEKMDVVFAGLNIIRNFSMLHPNQPVMACPELFDVLAAVTEKSLLRLPGESAPYSVLEYARVCRDAVSIITNLGSYFDLRKMPKQSTLAIFRLIANFLVSAWEVFQKRDPGFGPVVSIRDVPPTVLLSIDRALEAFCRLSLPDHNREVLASVIPGDELVELFASLVKLFPVSPRQIEAVRSVEDYLGRIEMIALCVYSLAFLAPPQARNGMRSMPGATAVMTRMVYDLTPESPDLRTSPFGILVRRVAETLGMLNGTVQPSGNSESMSFSAGGVEGKGWRFTSDAVEPGYLAHDAERVLEAMGWGKGDGRIWRVDPPTFLELDGLWSA